jgi:hypothetical protein
MAAGLGLGGTGIPSSSLLPSPCDYVCFSVEGATLKLGFESADTIDKPITAALLHQSTDNYRAVINCMHH